MQARPKSETRRSEPALSCVWRFRLEFHSVLEYSVVVQSETIYFGPERNEIEFFCCGCVDASYLSKITINTYVYLPKGLEHKLGIST